MIDVALLSVIRRWHFREGMPIREITRRTGLSRNTVRKYLASGVVEPRYSTRKSPSRLDDYELTLTSWLFRESRRHRKQRRSIRQLHSDLVQLGYNPARWVRAASECHGAARRRLRLPTRALSSRMVRRRVHAPCSASLPRWFGKLVTVPLAERWRHPVTIA